ncbi:hypothetical protein PILCRDRAFT_824467 [Piloderma croceum F 1598]|uniref:Uncharacterized protein n=1 Tax=Piloderma croceum (strain F 1598) TaxID=765440 RepID=A0A0C3BLQ5_PILCF|nr:hypothetical protein PILCRDRAFT_826608 [Piloderma croceum F 1598]KIM78252.1 hypothetical protein PILCRDRAFT_824467 [Piloderma croceum F 1598]
MKSEVNVTSLSAQPLHLRNRYCKKIWRRSVNIYVQQKNAKETLCEAESGRYASSRQWTGH